jgi:hypothetical protein
MTAGQITGTGQPWKDTQDRTAGAGQPGTGQVEQAWDRSAWETTSFKNKNAGPPVIQSV